MVSNRPHRRRRKRLLRTSDDPDALVIDPELLPEMSGTVLHFSELRPGDIFFWPENTNMINAINEPMTLMFYIGQGHYVTANGMTNRGFWQPDSGMLVQVMSQLDPEEGGD